MQSHLIKAAIAKLKRGDIQGLAVLVKAYQVRAIRAAYLITQDRPLAEDVVQTAFVRIYHRIDQYDTSRPFAPWFMRIVVNDAVKASTRGNRQVSLYTDSDDHPPLADLLTDTTPEPSAVAESTELRQTVVQALNALTPEQRAVVVMRYYLDFSESEMAHELDTPPGTIKWRLHAARKRLRGLLRPADAPVSGLQQSGWRIPNE